MGKLTGIFPCYSYHTLLFDFTTPRYFSKNSEGQVLSVQSGVVRTNCMDNLDRTNVVQVSYIWYCYADNLSQLYILHFLVVVWTTKSITAVK